MKVLARGKVVVLTEAEKDRCRAVIDKVIGSVAELPCPQKDLAKAAVDAIEAFVAAFADASAKDLPGQKKLPGLDDAA